MADSLLRFAFKAYRRVLRRPVRTSRDIWTVRDGILLRVEDEEGRTSFGEIAPIERFGTETLVGAIAWCGSVGKATTEAKLRAVPRGLPCCAAAVDATLTLLQRGRPAAGAERLEVVCLLPTGTEALGVLDRAVAAGFKTFKLKIGVTDFSTEEVHIARLLDCLPDRARLRLDANGGLDSRTAIRWLEAAADWPVEFIEQPLPVAADRDLVRLAHDHATPLALDESVRHADDIKRWRDHDWPGVFVIKPALAGAPADLLDEVRIAPGQFVFSSALETAIGTAAGVRFALVAGVTRPLGYGVAGFFEDDGLGGGVAASEISEADLATWNLEAVWSQL